MMAANDADDVAPDAGFADRKSPGAFRTIGEVSRALHIRQHVLRYWEEQFPMLRPVKRSGNRRYYRPEDVALIETIDRLVHREGYTLRGARLALESARGAANAVAGAAAAAPGRPGAPQPAERVAAELPPPPTDKPFRLSELLAIRATLAAVLDS